MKKVLTCEVPLLTPTGKVLTPIQIVYDDAEVISNPPPKSLYAITETSTEETEQITSGLIPLLICK